MGNFICGLTFYAKFRGTTCTKNCHVRIGDAKELQMENKQCGCLDVVHSTLLFQQLVQNYRVDQWKEKDYEFRS